MRPGRLLRSLFPIVVLVVEAAAVPAQATTRIAEYRVPTAKSDPEGIAAGPDGNLWFTEFSGANIGWITTGGTITEYPSPRGPWGIAAGPDGNLWFTAATANKIGRITTGGVITTFVIPTDHSFPLGIAAGPDGNLWFAEQTPRANNIGRITTSGAVTEYPIPTAESVSRGITAGQDGRQWFTESEGDRIGALRPSAGSAPDYGAGSWRGPTNRTPDAMAWSRRRSARGSA